MTVSWREEVGISSWPPRRGLSSFLTSQGRGLSLAPQQLGRAPDGVRLSCRKLLRLCSPGSNHTGESQGRVNMVCSPLGGSPHLQPAELRTVLFCRSWALLWKLSGQG